MKVGALLEKRRDRWRELEDLGNRLRGRVGRMKASEVSLFGKLYRDACADLALADAYQLPPETVEYLHRLVARSHNLLYRSRGYDYRSWAQLVFIEVPRACFHDKCVHLAFLLFWGLFVLAAVLSYHDVEFANLVLGEGHTQGVESSFSEFDHRDFGTNFEMACFYVWNNAGIGLLCFSTSVLFIPGLVTIAYNAVVLGATFGFMFRAEVGESGENFQNFVTAHGPFELMAIVLSAGAGLRVGMGFINTRGMTRSSSIMSAGREALPVVCVAVLLFMGAAVIEGFISPMATLPWAAKGLIALICSTLLLVYFVVLGFPWRQRHEA